jgi:hypothetical protein
MKHVLKGNNPFKLAISLSQSHCFDMKSMRYFDKVEHPFAKSLLDIYIEQTKEPLWLQCAAYGASPVPVKTATRRMRHAMRDALAVAGYDRFGRRVPVDGESSVVADLYGTLRVISSDPLAICNNKFADLLKSAKQIVSFAEVQIRRNKNGRHIAPPLQRRPTRTHGAQQAQNTNVIAGKGSTSTRSLKDHRQVR